MDGVDGTPEFAAELFAMRGSGKRIISVANTMMASAAAWIGLQADEVVVSPSSLSGSIGVWILHQNLSKMFEDMGIENTLLFAGDRKVDGNPFEPLSDEAEAALKADLARIHKQFIAAAAKARGISAAKARTQFGDGRTMMAEEAVSVGLADRVETLEQVLDRLTRRHRPRRNVGADRLQDGTDTEIAPEEVHVPGEPVDSVQSCQRCGEVLIDNRNSQVTGYEPAQFWTPGEVVLVTRDGGRASGLTLEPTCKAADPKPADTSDADAARDRDILELEEILARP